MELQKRRKIIIQGVLRTVLVCIIAILIMYLFGHLKEKIWIIIMSLLLFPWYWVYVAMKDDLAKK